MRAKKGGLGMSWARLGPGACFLAGLWAMLLAGPAAASPGGTWEGTIQGLKCAVSGQVCPVDMEDPMAALETSYVLLRPDGAWYVLPNLSANLLARLINQKVRVTGEKSPRYNSIKAQELAVFRDGQWKTLWSPEREMKLRRDLEWLRPPYPPWISQPWRTE
ncbi:MAG: hypothetical protein KQJ78_01095 [Deltaproteobacteria bacterium]|nr:hypothetical protein [Deltaproteobacteria bacterium]